MKAYWWTDQPQSEWGMIVFEQNARYAKAAGHAANGFSDGIYTECRVRRVPALDGLRTAPCVLDQWPREWHERAGWPPPEHFM